MRPIVLMDRTLLTSTRHVTRQMISLWRKVQTYNWTQGRDGWGYCGVGGDLCWSQAGDSDGGTSTDGGGGQSSGVGRSCGHATSWFSGMSQSGGFYCVEKYVTISQRHLIR